MLMAIGERWKVIPPVSVSMAAIAAAFGAKAGAAPAQKQGDLSELAAAFGGISKGKPEWLTKTE